MENYFPFVSTFFSFFFYFWWKKFLISVISSKTLFNLFHLKSTGKIFSFSFRLSSFSFCRQNRKQWGGKSFPIIFLRANRKWNHNFFSQRRIWKSIILNDKTPTLTQIQIILFVMPSLEYQLRSINCFISYFREICLIKPSRCGMLGRLGSVWTMWPLSSS